MIGFFCLRVLLDAISTLKLEDVREEAEKADVIGIDEGQFVSFTKLHSSPVNVCIYSQIFYL